MKRRIGVSFLVCLIVVGWAGLGWTAGPTTPGIQRKINIQGRYTENNAPIVGRQVEFEVADVTKRGFVTIAKSAIPTSPITVLTGDNGIFNAVLDFSNLSQYDFTKQYTINIYVYDKNRVKPGSPTYKQLLNSVPYSITAITALGLPNVFTSNNMVGVGTMPAYPVDIVGRMRVQGTIGNANNTAGVWLTGREGQDSAFVGLVDANNVGFYGSYGTGWGLTMNCTTGNVGIGTANALWAKLCVAGNGDQVNLPAIYGAGSSGTGWTYGELGANPIGNNYGVYGYAGEESGNNIAGNFLTGDKKVNTYGVYSVAGNSNNVVNGVEQASYGGWFWSKGSKGTGVFGKASGFASYGGWFESSGQGGYGLIASATGQGGQAIYANGPVGGTHSWVPASDIRLKTDIRNLGLVLPKLKNIRSVTYHWRPDIKGKNFPKGRQIGLIAQEVEKEFPELVSNGQDGYKALSYDKFTSVLLEAIKEQQKQIEALKAEVEGLKGGKGVRVSGDPGLGE